MRENLPHGPARALQHTLLACGASLLLHALALGGLAWLYRASVPEAGSVVDLQLASVYLAPARRVPDAGVAAEAEAAATPPPAAGPDRAADVAAGELRTASPSAPRETAQSADAARAAPADVLAPSRGTSIAARPVHAPRDGSFMARDSTARSESADAQERRAAGDASAHHSRDEHDPLDARSPSPEARGAAATPNEATDASPDARGADPARHEAKDASPDARGADPAHPGATDTSSDALALAARQPAPDAVPSTAPAASAAAPAAAEAAAIEWRVQAWLARHRHYPRAARRAGAEGTVWVRFVVDRGGALRGSEVMASSGHAVLDRAALELLRRASPFPALPAGLAPDEIELVLPIQYDLTRAERG